MDPRTAEYVFSVDAETDGLWGPVWAIGVVVLSRDGSKAAEFAGQVDSSDLADEWVIEHIVPLVDLPRYPNRQALRDAFWTFWMSWREQAIPVADCGDKVEAELFRSCVMDNLAERQWLAPWPLYDLGTLLLLCGFNPQKYREGEEASRIELAGLAGQGLNLHNPVDDAFASGLCWIEYRKAAEHK